MHSVSKILADCVELFGVIVIIIIDRLCTMQDYESFRQRLKSWLFSSY